LNRAVELISELEPNQSWMIGVGARNFYMVELKPEPEIWVLVSQA